MKDKVVLLLISDGRDEYRDRTIESAKLMLPTFDRMVEIDDADHKLGFAGAIAEGWQQVAPSEAEWVFHLEADFTFRRQVPIDRMVAVLRRFPHLAQICLKRQPWNDREQAAGGIVEMNPDAYEQRVDRGDIFTEHRICFSTNPCLYPAAICRQGWPQVEHSEGIFTHRLLEDPEMRFAFWGGKFDEPFCDHIGEVRSGCGY